MKKLISVLFFLFCPVLYSQNWVNHVLIPPPPPLFSAHAYNTQIAWLSGANNIVLYTSDGGTNWIRRNVPVATSQIYGIHSISPQTALCIANPGGGIVFRTSNSGANWQPVLTRINGTLNDLEFINALTGYVYGNPGGSMWFFARTTNGGISFDTTVPRPSAPANILGFPNAMYALLSATPRIWFGTNQGIVVYSTNGGTSWTASNTPGNQLVHTVFFLDALTGFCAGNQAFKSTDGGRTWGIQGYPGTGNFYSVSGIAGYLWYARGNQIYYSINQGLSFVLQHTSPLSGSYRQLSFSYQANDNSLSTITGWGVTEDGVVSGYNDNSIGIEPISSEIPQSYNLLQNYPNPFNPSTKIRFDIPQNTFAELSVFDLRGVLVEEIFSGLLNAGSYSARFDGSHLSSGVYFYKLKAGDFTSTMKMILIK
ncbi:MAG: T9SS type A sorting domain-containing protein [Chlorobi bacterium]|nr:T9SS type A sorting domain-containing protein [Chlorobiota bacterium]MCI0715978.1 T9SS type A sorting domain-containing protein [Chlorobiota bacterium]